VAIYNNSYDNIIRRNNMKQSIFDIFEIGDIVSLNTGFAKCPEGTSGIIDFIYDHMFEDIRYDVRINLRIKGFDLPDHIIKEIPESLLILDNG